MTLSVSGVSVLLIKIELLIIHCVQDFSQGQAGSSSTPELHTRATQESFINQLNRNLECKKGLIFTLRCLKWDEGDLTPHFLLELQPPGGGDCRPSELVVVESLTGDLAGQVVHVLLHLESVGHKRDQLTLADPSP